MRRNPTTRLRGTGDTPLTPGEVFSVCATVAVRIPLMPEFFNATVQFVVDRDRYVGP